MAVNFLHKQQILFIGNIWLVQIRIQITSSVDVKHFVGSEQSGASKVTQIDFSEARKKLKFYIYETPVLRSETLMT